MLSVWNRRPQFEHGFGPLIWRLVCLLIAIYCVVLAVETAFRISFPWDMYIWPESPFLTNLLKLDHHLPIYTSPADGNSFVYSPGLEYICFALLKPFGLELDIRYCRVIVVALGLLASFFGALAITKLLRSQISGGKFLLVSMGFVWLILSKNFVADIAHPDNLHTCHAVAVFWLCLLALEKKSFRLGVVTVFIGGLGVLTKQTEFLAWCGPIAAFALFSGWGWKRNLILAAVGFATFLGALYLLWLPQYGRFFTFGLLKHQGVTFGKTYYLAFEMLSMDRALLVVLAIFSAFYLWETGGTARRYFLIWCCVGFFCVLPNVSAFLKIMGMWNNLSIFEVWFGLIVWPSFVLYLNASKTVPGETRPAQSPRWPAPVSASLCLILFSLLIVLIPMKWPPKIGYYKYCRDIEASVSRDLNDGKKVLVSHGAEFFIRAGNKSVPKDRGNSILELVGGGYGSLSDFPARLSSHYYDRIYLIEENFYCPDISADIEKNYVEESSIKNPGYVSLLVMGYSDLMDHDCRIMVPRK
jgi:hypothetical protein